MDIQFRLIREDEVHALLELYKHLAVNDLPLPEERVIEQVWESFINDPKIFCVVGEVDGQLVTSCTLIVVAQLHARGALVCVD